MNRTTLISEMQKFHFGSKVICSDGEDGILTHVIFDPKMRKISYIGVKQGRFFGKTVHLPFENVVSATGDGVTLNVRLADLAAAKSEEPGGATLSSKTLVENVESGTKRSLIIIAVHPESGELAYIVVHDLRPGRHTLLREEFITALETGRIIASITEYKLDVLPPYRPDSELLQEVESILFDLTPLHIDMKAIAIRVLDGVLSLDGNISTDLRSDTFHVQLFLVAGPLQFKH